MAPKESPRDLRIGVGRSTVVSLAGSAAFVIFGIALIAGPRGGGGAKAVGVLTVVIFGCFFFLGVRMLQAGGLYVLTAAGILFPYRKWPMLPWSDVQAIRIIKRRGHRYLAIDARDTDARLRHMKSGKRGVRTNLRTGLGLVTIPEQLSPTSLEELQTEIERRRATGGTAAIPMNQGATMDRGATILPGAAASVPRANAGGTPATMRTLRNVAVVNALMLLLAMLRYHTQTPRVLLLADAVALLVGAAAVQLERILAGSATIVAAAIFLMILNLSAGKGVAVATRVADLFLPVCVLLIALANWPRQRRPLR